MDDVNQAFDLLNKLIAPMAGIAAAIVAIRILIAYTKDLAMVFANENAGLRKRLDEVENELIQYQEANAALRLQVTELKIELLEVRRSIEFDKKHPEKKD